MKMTLKSLILAAAVTAGATASAWSAQASSALSQPAAASAADAAAMTDGEVKKIDKDTQKVTLKHGEIKNLGMPGMTMVFKVQDPTVLDKLQPGQKVRFTAEKANGALVVTHIEAAQ